MSTRTLPPNSSLIQLKKQAKDLLKTHQSGDAEAIARLRASVSQLASATDAEVLEAKFALHDAQRVLAREYGFDNWRALVRSITEQQPVVDANAGFSHDELVAYFAAVRDLDLDGVRACLDANPALTEARAHDKALYLRGEALEAALREPLTEQSSTAIHLAANIFLDPRGATSPKSVELMQLLLDYSADPDAMGFNENQGCCTAIVIAAWVGGIEKMRLLLEVGSDVTGEQGTAALDTAASHGRTDRFDLLVEHGAPSTPWLMVLGGMTDRVIALVDEDPELLTSIDDRGYTLMQAGAEQLKRNARDGMRQTGRVLVEALIERGVEVDVFTAAALDDVGRLGALLQDDSTLVNEQLGDGKTPVDFAVQVGSHDTLRLLLQAGADPNRNEPLNIAGRRDDTESCRRLIEYGANVTDKAVLSAAWRNQESACLGVMLDNGGNASAIDGRGTLHWVAADNPQSVQLLIDAGADVNMRAPGATNGTPLHHARNNVDSIERLLAAGADSTLTDANGDTPLDLAERDGTQDAVELLKRHI